MGSLALGLMLVCQGAGNVLHTRSETLARLLRVGSVLVFGPMMLVLFGALLIGLFGLSGALLRAGGVLALVLLLYGAIKLLLPIRWQAWLFGEDYTRRG